MIHSNDLWKLEFLSSHIDIMITANESTAVNPVVETEHARGISFGIKMVNEDLVKVKETLDEQLQLLKKKAESPFMVDDLTYEGGDELESA